MEIVDFIAVTLALGVVALIAVLGGWIVARMTRSHSFGLGVRWGLIFCGGYLGIALILVAMSLLDDDLAIIFRIVAGAPVVWLAVLVGLKEYVPVDFWMRYSTVFIALSAVMLFAVGWVAGRIAEYVSAARNRARGAA